MKYKLGAHISGENFGIVVLNDAEKPSILNFLKFDLKVNSFFDNLSLQDEKELLKSSNLIKDSLKNAHLQEQDVNILLPDQACSLQIIKLPLVSEKEIVSAIELQADEFVPYPIEDASFDYQILSVNHEEKQMFLLIIVTLKDLIDRVSDFFLDLGLYPASLEPESTGLYRLFINDYVKTNNEVIMVINIDDKSTQTSILNIKKKQLITTHSFSIGDAFFHRAIQYNLNLFMEASKELFQTIKPEDETYAKIVAPLFTEYAKEVQKTLLAAVQQLGFVPKEIFIHSNQYANTYLTMFKSNNLLGQYNIQTINLNNFNSKIAINENFNQHFSNIILPLSATI